MEVRGKVIQKMEPQSGTSKAGNEWKKQDYVIETLEAYPKKINFDFFGDKADQYVFEVGDVINLSFDIESREYNGRWYTSIRGWKGEKVDAGTPAPAQAAQPFEVATPPAPDFSANTESDDLPF